MRSGTAYSPGAGTPDRGGPTGGSIHAATLPRPLRPHRLRSRPRVHGLLGILRSDRRGGGAGRPRGRPRPRLRFPRHRRHVRPRPQRDPDRRRAAGPPRPGGRRDEVRHRARAGLGRATDRQQPGLPHGGLRGIPAPPRRRDHRPLLLPPPRPGGAGGRDDRRHGAPRRGRKGAGARPVGGLARDPAGRPRGPPDRRGADRILAVEPGAGMRPDRDLPGARCRARRLFAARPRLPDGPSRRRGARAGRVPPQQPALPGRGARPQPPPRRGAVRLRRRARSRSPG